MSESTMQPVKIIFSSRDSISRRQLACLVVGLACRYQVRSAAAAFRAASPGIVCPSEVIVIVIVMSVYMRTCVDFML